MTDADRTAIAALDQAIREEAAKLISEIRNRDGEGNTIPSHLYARLNMALVRRNLLPEVTP